MPALAFVGDANWTNYTLTLRARKISGDEGFLISFGAPGDTTASYWNLGGFGNTKHLIQKAGVPTSDVAAKIETGVWYNIKVEISGIDVRCYLDDKLVHDTARFLDASDRADRFNQLINSAGFGYLNNIERNGLINLRDRNVYIGDAARATFDAMPTSGLTFNSLPPAQQALIIRKVNKNRMTWSQGFGFDGSDGYRDYIITLNADIAVKLHNSLSVFDEHLTVNNSPGTPTADASFGGYMRMGQQFSVRTFIHEIAHTLGSGTIDAWYNNFNNGVWQGKYVQNQIAEFDGAGAAIHQAGVHFYPYGLNYDSEYSDENARRAILIIAAMRRDMGMADQVNWNYSGAVANGAYAIIPRNAQNRLLAVEGDNPANNTGLLLWESNGSVGQKFLLDLQPEGTYRIRTALEGNRAVELPGGNTDNGTRVKLYDDNNYGAQRWFFIPTDGGWFKIAPLFNNFKGMDVVNAGTGLGTPVQNYDYLDNFAQQWKFIPVAQITTTTNIADGTYTLTPRHATDKRLEVFGFNGANGDAIDIYAPNGTNNQKFLLDKQDDGTYRIRTALAGNRAVELPFGDTFNGNKVKLYDDNGSAGQRWYFIPTDNGYYKIAPKNDIGKSMDVENISTADGALVQSYDYLGNYNQQWKLTDVGTPSIQMSVDKTAVSENVGKVTLVVTRNGDTSAASSVVYATSDGSATAGSDYTATSGTLTFAAGQTSAEIPIVITDDNAVEGDETFAVTLSNATGATLGTPQSTQVTITDNNATPSLSVADVSVAEGDSATVNATFTVKLSAASSKAVTVKYATANGTATAGSDYTATNGTLTFAVGEITKTVEVPVAGDTLVEPDETFAFNLSEAANATIERAQATGTIINNDVAKSLPSLSVEDIVVSKGKSGTTNAQFTVTLSAPSALDVAVQYATSDGSATAGSDYIATSGTLTFAAGQTRKTVNVTITGDSTSEVSENFTLNLSAPTNAMLSRTQAKATIINNDTAEPESFTLSLSASSYSVAENGKTATVTVTRSGNTSSAAKVEYATADGTATAGSDYTALSGTLTFAVGEASQNILVPLLDDTVDEEDETFGVTLSKPQGDAVLAAPDSATVTITDNDAAPSLSVADVSLSEGNSGTKNAVFTVTLSAKSERVVTVKYATSNGTATAGSDYTTTSGSLTFAAGTTSKTIAVPIVGDTTIEADETFTLTLSAATNATLSRAQATGTLVNDDTLKPIAFTVTLAPKNPLTRDRVTAIPVIANGVGVTYIYQWFVGSTAVQEGASNTLDLFKPGFGDRGDVISVAVTAHNARGETGTARQSATVGNSAPFAFSGTARALAGIEAAISFRIYGNPGAADSDGDALTYKIVGNPRGGTASFATNAQGQNELRYIARSNFIGVDVIRFVAVDAQGFTGNVATLGIDVTIPARVPPTAQDANAQTFSGLSVDVPVTGSNADGTVVSFKRVGGPKNGVGEFVTLSDGSTVLRYTSRSNFVGTEEVRFVALTSDGHPSNVAMIRISVNSIKASPPNQAPSANGS